MSIEKEHKKQLFTTWVNDFTDDLMSWAYHKTSSKETAEDLIQETFLSAFNSFDNFKNQSSPKTWLLSILNYKIIDFYRKKSKSLSVIDSKAEDEANKRVNDLFDENDYWKNPKEHAFEVEEHLLDNVEFNLILEKCMENLPEKWRIAIHSKYLTDVTVDEICKQLEISTANYWQIIHRTKLHLKNCIDNNWK
jgi:RNA polymerase sigma-70 factor (TIGR02943 family)